MRTVLMVFGIAVGILVIAIVFTPSKGLVDNPAEEAYKRQQEFDKQEQLAAKKAAAPADTKKPDHSTGKFESLALSAQGNVTAVMTVKDRGTVTLEVFPKEAPKTVGHFLDLVRRKFYDGILFHRVVPNFVVQAGDPGSRKLTTQEVAAKDDHAGGTSGLGGGGSGANGSTAGIPYEETARTHDPGSVSMALSAPRTPTGDSQFFINLKPNHTLDGDYCVFGRVTKGMEIVEKIKRGDRIIAIALISRKPIR